MMKAPHLLACLLAAASTLTPTASQADEAAFLTGVRQLTFEGKRAGEGYFSADGKKMIFQSEREADNPFYQIYLLDLETGDQRRVSPGFGKTTCAWIYPDGNRLLFASTHLDPESKAKQDAEFKERETNRVRKYSWDYDEHFDLFAYSLTDNKLTQLTTSQGYDAEGAVSPDGRQIVFASNRAAYEGQLSPSDAERLKIDKQYFMDIYVMNADGTNPRRLTAVPGYDGGPFFSADGSRICWRRFDEKGMTAEIYTMKADGSDQRQITKVGAMSWAPYFHPSGDYLVFTNNVNGFANFELYIVDAGGKHEPVRVTETDGFDGLPVFSPDGKKLSWTSGRTANTNSQIFIADWNDAAARKALGIEKTGGAGAPVAATPKPGTVEKPPGAPDLSTTSAEIAPADMKQHITYLASDALEGRMTGTRGEQLATEYMASVFQQLGLVPFGDDNTYYSSFEFTAGVALGQGNKMELTNGTQKSSLACDLDWRPLSFSQTGDIPASDIVFAGYGIETPDDWVDSNGKKLEAYSSYFHLDVKDKWVLVLRYLPESLSQDRRNELMRFSSLRHKALTARQKGARGILVASGPNSKVVEQLVPLTFDASLASSGIAAISVTDALADRLLATAQTGRTLVQIQSELDKGAPIQGMPLGKLKLGAHISIAQEKKKGRNVLAVLCKGTEPDFHTAHIIIGAHIDHLGTTGGS
ncbi:MAG: peptidase M28, partial [Roseimicrobium sp.]